MIPRCGEVEVVFRAPAESPSAFLLHPPIHTPILASWFPGAPTPPARDYVNTVRLILSRTIFALRIWEGCYGDWGRAAGRGAGGSLPPRHTGSPAGSLGPGCWQGTDTVHTGSGHGKGAKHHQAPLRMRIPGTEGLKPAPWLAQMGGRTDKSPGS